MQENVVVLLHDRKVNKMENLNNLKDRLIELKKYVSDVVKDPIVKTVICDGLEEFIYQVNVEIDSRKTKFALCDAMPNPDDCKEFEVQKDAGPLEFTIDLMRSGDYKKRFHAEYCQTKIRYDKLHKMLIKAEAGTLDFKPTCSLELLKEQKYHMGMYLHALEVRAEIEGIEL